MLPPLKHFRVNWVDGMKISKDHFIGLEDAMGDQIRDMSGISLNHFNYGLLPPGPNARQSLEVQIYADRSEQVTIKVSECRAVTPGGARIEIQKHTPPVETVVNLERLKTQAYEIYVVVDPFARIPFGQPNPGESPMRQPYALPQYRLEVLPYPQTHQPEYSAFQLCVGRLRVEGEAVKLSEHYIPACTTLMSHPRLAAAHQKLMSGLGEAEVAATGIIQRIKGKEAISQLDQSLLYLAEKIADFIAHSLDNYRLLLLQGPPVQVITSFARFARVMNVSLNSMVRKHREELLDYFHKWFELAPRDMENLLRSMLTITYDHNDTYASLNKVELFTDRILVLLKKLNELNYVGQAPEQKEKVYGWLVVHTENRKRQVYKVKNKNTIIGRTDGSHHDVDFNITDDTWISRRHAKLTVNEEGGRVLFQLTDLGSNNGTFIHDTRTRLKPNDEFVLMDGDTFQAGKTNILFKSTAKIDTEQNLAHRLEAMDYFKVIEINDLVAG
jgi:hypothetical protein